MAVDDKLFRKLIGYRKYLLQVSISKNGKDNQVSIETFVSYLETLPDIKQKAVNILQVPSKQSQTRISFGIAVTLLRKRTQKNVIYIQTISIDGGRISFQIAIT